MRQLFMNFQWNGVDEDEEPRCVQLTNQHKAAIRFIRKVKFYDGNFSEPSPSIQEPLSNF